MINDENEMPSNPTSLRQLSKSRHNSCHLMSRMQRIRDKRMIYPESTLNKIVFISNVEGNGFQRQNINLYDVPAHIDLESMINGLNRLCFNQWRDSFEAMQAQPLHKYDLFHTVMGISVLLVIFVFLVFEQLGQFAEQKNIAYIFMGFRCFCSVLMMTEKRIDINKDLLMVNAIKMELIRLNYQEQTNFPDQPRFRWTCHKDCLWVACQFD